MNLENLGNIREDYKHEPRTARAQGLIITPQLVLKLYSMAKSLHPTGRTILDKKIDESEINPFIGLGFAILSEDMLNVARWDTEHPIVIKNQIYGFEGSVNSLELLDIRDIRPFCVWEGGIFCHEKELWKKYLQSKHSNRDKERYLKNFIEGNL
jgi:hypothetical protein